MSRRTNRRQFLKNTTLAGAGAWAAGSAGCSLMGPAVRPRSVSPNEKLNIGVVGCGGKGSSDTNNVSTENIVALCDVDEERAKDTFAKFPNAKRYYDFRVMLEKENLDAVVVSTADHMHAAAAAMAIKMSKHVFCQKPLTHDIYEARVLRELAKKHGVQTQMGNQGTSHDGLRRGVEIVQSGAIGRVREAHVWTNRPIWPQGLDRPTEKMEVPKTLSWDLWLGMAPWRPYHKTYCPWNWRGWWDFGTGALGDMACHTANLAFMALKLGYPTRIEAEQSGMTSESPPKWSIIRYEFPARGNMPPVKFTWYDGGKKPPQDLVPGQEMPGSGSLMVGDKGTLFSPNDYGSSFKLLPEKDFADYKGPDPWLPRVHGQEKEAHHHQEWIRACKGDGTPMSNFGYSGLLSEAMLLGNLAVRLGHPIEWDGPRMKVTNCDAAKHLVKREYRKGWTV